MKNSMKFENKQTFNKNFKMPYNKLLINLDRSVYGKILNLDLAVLTSLSLGQYGKTSV